MGKAIRILLQTTIPATEDDWHIGRFSLLRVLLESQVDEGGAPLYAVTARDRSGAAIDPVLSTLDTSDFDQLWLFAVDSGNGLVPEDVAGISGFYQRGGGFLVSRDHEDVGSSVCELGCVGNAHHFHSRRREQDETRRVRDDKHNPAISWPNYHSGRNGDYQRILPLDPLHELLRDPRSPSGVVEYFPAHPHEGAVGVPPGEHDARVIAVGRSVATGRPFNLAVAFERVTDPEGEPRGRGVAESSFHHFADYNWDVSMGCPSFVDELPGDEVARHPARLAGIKAYVRNLARWLAPSHGSDVRRLADVHMLAHGD
ncbi:hypothetical protein DSM104443_02341 [Usitatibacter rugosus]|uniref:Uncharacterized protein n=1 Tax=Usitatibacter rugosus TaxID=2732067 RepID=A0A6M4GWL7_9PROT|nr:hypothetical protein [Usitatibacter rugosus]QJR11268.1 hypothetical protein DSM104443_02341 [Usitatibacter rugosus]